MEAARDAVGAVVAAAEGVDCTSRSTRCRSSHLTHWENTRMSADGRLSRTVAALAVSVWAPLGSFALEQREASLGTLHGEQPIQCSR